MATPSQYKPSPLSFNSPRTSPFRRPESPASPSPLRNTTTATTAIPAATSTSPTKQIGTPSKLNPNSSLPSTPNRDTWTPRGLVASMPTPLREPDSSPTRGSRSDSYSLPESTSNLTERTMTPTKSSTPRQNSNGADANPSLNSPFESSPIKGPSATTHQMSSPLMTRPSYTTRALSNPSSNALSKLPTAQVHSLRESFQILDRDDDGQVNKDDISDMLSQLGLPVTPAELNAFFPPGGPQTMSMPTFLTQISTLLAAMSQPTELLNAFAAFDDDDSGQVDLTELRDALLNTAPEAGERTLSPSEVDRIIGGFSGRRAFGKSMMGAGKRGEVFKYQEFVASVGGGNERKEEQE